MKLNKLIFPAPRPSYTANQLLGEIVYIPKEDKKQGSSSIKDPYQFSSKSSARAKNPTHIPCLFLPYTSGSSKLLLYFHGNAEDIGLSYEMLDHLRSSLKVNILAVEYPAYGIYEDSQGCSSEKITQDSVFVFEYILKETGLTARDVLIFGRSMGSGPATYLSAHYNPGALILMSPYTSIKNVVKNKIGFLSFLVAEHFDNINLMQKVCCPTFIVHGQKDSLIPYEQAQQLHERCQGQTFMVLPTDMTHNDFDFYQDLIKPIFQFLLQIKLNTGATKKISKVQFHENLYIPPSEQEEFQNYKNLMDQGRKKKQLNSHREVESGYMSSANAYVPKKKDLQIEKDKFEYRPTSVFLEREDLRGDNTKEENKNRQ